MSGSHLSDEHGRAVTALAMKATNNEYPPDALMLAAVSNVAEERAPLKQYMRAHGNEKMDLKTSAAETLRAMEVKKERVGPGMDRGGCTLVNPERRATLLQGSSHGGKASGAYDRERLGGRQIISNAFTIISSTCCVQQKP